MNLQTMQASVIAQITLNHSTISTSMSIYEGRSINKFQNGAIQTVLKIGKIRDTGFVGNLILNIHTTFLHDDVIIVTSSDNTTQSNCVLVSPSVYYRNSQVINSIRTTEKKTKKLNTLMLRLYMLWCFFFYILSKFVQTFVSSVNKLLNARCKERCWLLCKPLPND